MGKYRIVTFKIKPEDYYTLVFYAYRTDKSTSEVIREAIKEYLSNHTQRTEVKSVNEPEKKVYYICNICNEKFSNPTAALRHLSVHNMVKIEGESLANEPEKKVYYICNICNEKFKHRHTVLRHLLTHSKVVEEFKKYFTKEVVQNENNKT